MLLLINLVRVIETKSLTSLLIRYLARPSLLSRLMLEGSLLEVNSFTRRLLRRFVSSLEVILSARIAYILIPIVRRGPSIRPYASI